MAVVLNVDGGGIQLLDVRGAIKSVERGDRVTVAARGAIVHKEGL